MSALDAAAARLSAATRLRMPCRPVRDLIDAGDVVAAYAVQTRLVDEQLAAGRRVVGRKIGLTSPAVQAQLGVDQPDFGVLLDDMDVSRLDAVPMDRLLQPKAEAEIAFVLGPGLEVASAHVALEIVDSRIADWDISYVDTVADNASSGLFVVGDPIDVEPRLAGMTLHRNGELVSSGSGRDCLGDPLAALAWLARTAEAFGEPLQPGQVVLSGALGPMVPVAAGDLVEATIAGVPLAVRFGKAS